jgi:HAMP domain-containing protein
MALATATAKPERVERRRRARTPGSRLGRLIVTLNLVALAILVGGALLLNELRQGLVEARLDSLRTQGELIANVIDSAATIGDPEPALAADNASDILQSLFIPRSQRVRLFDAEGNLIADSYVATDRVEREPLPPARKPGEPPFIIPGFAPKTRTQGQAEHALEAEVKQALTGQTVSGVRLAETGGRVVSVSIPIERVRAVLGVLTLEAGDVDQIIGAERAAMIPFIVTAVAVNLISSFALTQLIARPVRRLARAADSVRLSHARAIDLPDLAARRDEVGDLARSLEDMTHTLSGTNGGHRTLRRRCRARDPQSAHLHAVGRGDARSGQGLRTPRAVDEDIESGRRPPGPAGHRHLQRLAARRRTGQGRAAPRRHRQAAAGCHRPISGRADGPALARTRSAGATVADRRAPRRHGAGRTAGPGVPEPDRQRPLVLSSRWRGAGIATG